MKFTLKGMQCGWGVGVMSLCDLMGQGTSVCSLTKGVSLQGISELLEEAPDSASRVVYWDVRY